MSPGEGNDRKRNKGLPGGKDPRRRERNGDWKETKIPHCHETMGVSRNVGREQTIAAPQGLLQVPAPVFIFTLP